MRKVILPVAAAAASLAFAAPASAQWFPQPSYGNGYNPGYNPGYGHRYGANWGHVRSLQVRIDRIQHQIRDLARFGMISRGEYRRLRSQSRQIERSLRRNIRDGYGLTRREAYIIERQIARLEYRMARDVRGGRRYAYGWRF